MSISDLDRKIKKKIKLSEQMLADWTTIRRLIDTAGRESYPNSYDDQFQNCRTFILRTYPDLTPEMPGLTATSPLLGRHDVQPIVSVLGKLSSLLDIASLSELDYEILQEDLNWGDTQLNLLIGNLHAIRNTVKEKVSPLYERDAQIVSELKQELRSIEPRFEVMYDGAYDALLSKNKEKLRHALASMRQLLNLVIDKMGRGEKRKEKVMSILGTVKATELVDSLAEIVSRVHNLESKEMKELEPDFDDTAFAIKVCEYTLHYLLTRRPKNRGAPSS
jgi:hypothetical protein